jgi:hypothetical protein
MQEEVPNRSESCGWVLTKVYDYCLRDRTVTASTHWEFRPTRKDADEEETAAIENAKARESSIEVRALLLLCTQNSTAAF